MTSATAEKSLLNLACGNRILPARDGWKVTHHDVWAHRPEITVTHDLEDLPWPWGDSQFDEIFAFDIIEHVQRPIKFINELWRIAKDGAKVTVHTCWAGPQSGAREAWRDPTHVRPFHEASFDYFDPLNGGIWFENYGKFYSPARFEVVQKSPEPPDNILFVLRAIK